MPPDHPIQFNQRQYQNRVVCGNYLIGPNDPGERLHRFPQVITGLG